MLQMKLALLSLILILVPMADGLVINELMYNPAQCGDSDCEWIELYNSNNQTINLTGWTLDGSSLNGIEIGAHSYIILATELIDGDDADNESFEAHWGNNDGVFNESDGNFSAYHISFSLKNSNDVILLTNGSHGDILEYSSSWGANGNNYTLERINATADNDKDNWGTSLIIGGTPGRQNSLHGTSNTYNIHISEFLPNPHGDDNAPMPQGEWLELSNAGEATDLKWAFFKDKEGHTLYITDTTGGTTLSLNGFLTVYVNGLSGFLNNGVEEIFFYSKEGKLIDSVSYAIADEGSSWAKVDGNWQQTMPTPGKENADFSGVKNSKFTIDAVQDLGSNKAAEFGQTIRVNVIGYKGDDTKSVLRMFVSDGNDKISKESKITISTKYTPFELAVPIQLVPNCNGNFEDKEYMIHIGWASEDTFFDTHPVKVSGMTQSLCEKVGSAKSTSKGTLSYDLLLAGETVHSGEQFTVTADVRGDETKHDIAVWAYVYRGSKTYSGEQEANKVKFLLQPHESKKVYLPISLGNEIDDGTYKLKLKLNKDNQKTDKEITRDITIIKGHGEILRFEYETDQITVEAKNAHAVDLVSFFGEQRKTINNTALFNVSLIEGKNIFFAKLVDEQEDITDVAQLNLLKEGSTIREVANVELSDEGEELLRQKLRSLRDVQQKRGRVVYESSSMKVREFLPWMFIGALLLLIVALVLKRV